MEVQNDEINLIDLWRIIVKRRYFIIGFPLGFAILAFVVSLLLPKVYEGEAILAIPMGQSNPIMSNLETEAIVNVLLKEIKKEINDGSPVDLLDNALAKTIIDIKIESISNSDSKIKIVVQVKGEHQKGYEVLNKVLDYLQTNSYVLNRFKNVRASIQLKRDETKSALGRAIKIRDETLRLMLTKTPVGFNPVELETKINDLNSKIIELDTDLTVMKGYEFVTNPFVYKKPVKPKVVVNVIISAIFGFLGDA